MAEGLGEVTGGLDECVEEVGNGDNTWADLVCSVKQELIQLPEDGIAFQLWPAAEVLAAHIAESQHLVTNQRVLELGAGCGLVGMTAAALGAAKVVLTDTAEVMYHLERNIAAVVAAGQAPEGVAMAAVLEWGDVDGAAETGQFQVVLLSDCTYWAHLQHRLLTTLQMVSDSDTLILLAHHWRRKDVESSFFEELKKGFNISVLHRAGEVDVMQLVLRSSSVGSDTKHDALSLDPNNVAAMLAYIQLLEQDLDSISSEPEVHAC